jgi:hypothetical protein
VALCSAGSYAKNHPEVNASSPDFGDGDAEARIRQGGRKKCRESNVEP